MNNRKIILGIETSTNISSVAIWDGVNMFEEVSKDRLSHSMDIFRMIDKVLLDANTVISSIDNIVCSRGPGGFTGLRVGVGIAKGLAYGQNINIIPMSPLQVVAYQAIKEGMFKNITVIQDARMNELYTANFCIQDKVPFLNGKESIKKINDFKIYSRAFAGTGTIEHEDFLIKNGAIISRSSYPFASQMIYLSNMLRIKHITPCDFYPNYIRNKVTY